MSERVSEYERILDLLNDHVGEWGEFKYAAAADALAAEFAAVRAMKSSQQEGK